VTTESDLDAQLLAQMREDFLAESGDILERLGPKLVELERDNRRDLIEDIFREVHTLKGAAGFVSLNGIQGLAHKMEDTLDALRHNKIAVTAELIDAGLSCVDLLSAMRDDALAGGEGQMDIAPLAARLEAIQAGDIVAPAAAGEAARSPGEAAGSLRVDTATMDRLMVEMGELITARNALLADAARLKDDALSEDVTSISRLIRQLQDAVTSARMAPVERLFNRFIPVVRKLARERGKLVRLKIEGAQTPMDRTVSELLYEPMVHLMRNAVDHGLETEAERERAGKPPEGLVRLSADRRGDNVVLTVSDDGAGIDPRRVRASAVKLGVLAQEAADALTDDQAVRLIFSSGLSTAAAVSDISGRGVGMDVVRQSVRQLRGNIDVRTELGRGTAFTIELPLVLAILQVLVVRADGQPYAIPLVNVHETLLVEPTAVKTMQHGEVLFLRGTPLPVRDLRDWLAAAPGQPARETAGDGARPAVVVGLERGKEVLTVDELMGKRQVVIKPLSDYLGYVRGVAGSAIMDDGTVMMVLDVEGLLFVQESDLPRSAHGGRSA